MYKHFFKRFFDFCISLIALICISPILLIVTIWLHFANKKGSLTPVPSPKGEGSKDSKGKEKGTRGKKKATPTSEGMRKLFINLGKKDGFYPGELMQFLNKHVHGHVEVGHIDLLQTMSYFEVPEEDAERVMKYVDGQQYKRREVRCNDANSSSPKLGEARRGLNKGNNKGKKRADSAPHPSNSGSTRTYKKEEWMQFLNPKGMKLKGEIPDFEEEGWAIRKPRKKQ